ncbi:MAG: HAD family phosphatase [Muribaculaceae bacterium]|nr:HAD family phosphatase [Muribaculaceae bacterium]
MIKNLLFDLGGVIMNIKRENAVKALTDLGMKDADKLLGDYVQHGVFLQLEEGKLSPQEFREAARSYFPDGGKGVTDRQIDDAFIKFLTGIPVHRLRALEKLHKNYGIYMLSNTNPIMWNEDILNAFKTDGHDINYYFDGIVTSFEAHCVKPHPEIFEYTIEKLKIKPEETIFLDDSQQNLDTARKLGFETLLVPSDTEFETLLKCKL